MNPAIEHALEHAKKWETLAEKYREIFDGLAEEVQIVHARSNRLSYELIEADRRRREDRALIEHLHADHERLKADCNRLKAELAMLKLALEDGEEA